MKNVRQLNLVAAVLVVFTFASCGKQTKNQEADIQTPEEVKKEKKQAVDYANASFADGMVGKVFQNYSQLRMSLVNADADGAQVAAGNMAESFTGERATMKATAEKIAETDDLEEQRKLFAGLTSQVEPLFKESVQEGTVYKMHCPMAFNNKGAYWLSDGKEIKNPYFGDKMLNCGSIKETFTKN